MTKRMGDPKTESQLHLMFFVLKSTRLYSTHRDDDDDEGGQDRVTAQLKARVAEARQAKQADRCVCVCFCMHVCVCAHVCVHKYVYVEATCG